MNEVNIYHIADKKQDVQEGISVMKGISLQNLLHEIVEEYKKPINDKFIVDSLSLSFPYKKLILSHILNANDYEWACSSHMRCEAMYLENKDEIESLIEEEINNYETNLEEIPKYKNKRNEVFWRKINDIK